MRAPQTLPGHSEDVLAAGVLDQLGNPVSGGERRIEPLERHDPWTPRSPHGDPDPIDPRRGRPHEVDGRVLASGRLRDRPGVAEDLPDGVGGEGDHLRVESSIVRGDRADVLIGDRAHRAECLGDDQIGAAGSCSSVGIELVDRVAAEGALA